MASNTETVKVTRWRGGQHPSLPLIAQRMTQEGLRPYRWSNDPNFRYPARSHTYAKVLYCVQGSLDIILPDRAELITLHPGDRLELARGIRHAQIVGPNGAQCLESELGRA
ncbi:MAG: cupin domain-containing protein [Aggregatilineales bacterium]